MMKFRYLFLPVGFSLMLLLVVQNSNAVRIAKNVEKKKKVVEEYYCETLFCKVEELAYFKGGPDSLKSFIANNTNYPDSAIDANIEGVVLCQFVISKTGKVTESVIIRGSGYSLDEEVLSVINSMPDWIPAERMGFVFLTVWFKALHFIYLKWNLKRRNVLQTKG